MSAVDIEIRHAIHPEHAESMGTDELREHFLITDLFRAGRIKAVYTHYDRMILLGIQPDKGPLAFGPELADLVKAEDFLARREIGIFNIGGRGRVMAGGRSYDLAPLDALYLPMGTHNVLFDSVDHANPALFYANSAPAHAAHPAHHIKAADIKGDLLGAQESANHRVLTKYMHPAAFPTCQLVMGRTELQKGNVWNTMPPHTHDRRMEAYLYHGVGEGQVVFHFMGRPDATRHLVVRNLEAVLSPPWSIHCGSGTAAYAFIWSMAGDNQTFTDMDAVPVPALF
jgi:4-deoxy-L-threo-5-hexosulose-uronate ketol-isomerase